MSNVIKVNILILIIVLNSCSVKKSDEKIQENTYEILSTIIDEYAKPRLIIPPPPLEGMSDTLKNDRDSIVGLLKTGEWAQQKYFVGLRPLNYEWQNKFKKSEVEEKFISLFQKLINRNNRNEDIASLTPSMIKLTRGNIIVPIKSQIRKNDSIWNYLNVLISYSNIEFNNLLDKAILVIECSEAEYHRRIILLLMENVEGQWKIRHEYTRKI